MELTVLTKTEAFASVKLEGFFTSEHRRHWLAQLDLLRYWNGTTAHKDDVFLLPETLDEQAVTLYFLLALSAEIIVLAQKTSNFYWCQCRKLLRSEQVEFLCVLLRLSCPLRHNCKACLAGASSCSSQLRARTACRDFNVHRSCLDCITSFTSPLIHLQTRIFGQSGRFYVSLCGSCDRRGRLQAHLLRSTDFCPEFCGGHQRVWFS